MIPLSWTFILSFLAGELDFYVNSNLKWAFELMRNGKLKGSHIDRFQVGTGIYAKLPRNASRVIDFRPTGPGQRDGLGYEMYVAVVVAPDFQSAEVYYHGTAPVSVAFTGGSADL